MFWFIFVVNKNLLQQKQFVIKKRIWFLFRVNTCSGRQQSICISQISLKCTTIAQVQVSWKLKLNPPGICFVQFFLFDFFTHFITYTTCTTIYCQNNRWLILWSVLKTSHNPTGVQSLINTALPKACWLLAQVAVVRFYFSAEHLAELTHTIHSIRWRSTSV